MRVTAGKYKGRMLLSNKYGHIRPTADVVKQAIFNKINFRLNGCCCFGSLLWNRFAWD